MSDIEHVLENAGELEIRQTYKEAGHDRWEEEGRELSRTFEPADFDDALEQAAHEVREDPRHAVAVVANGTRRVVAAVVVAGRGELLYAIAPALDERDFREYNDRRGHREYQAAARWGRREEREERSGGFGGFGGFGGGREERSGGGFLDRVRDAVEDLGGGGQGSGGDISFG